ncbi:MULTISPECIES: hypothetical protein [Methylopilaceae]|uniref:Uncharacterized protein n=2 Tax=Methylopilaceae TaxID=3149309 RepID=A0A4Q0MAY0_9HYPH|nr:MULTISPECIES: hypothetical protein [Methylocystaceae]QZO00590.1 hypothetical protein K6K41_02370 [Chenggangzhangella methanolivorans]RXF69946.1 hypothetical protein EK403_17590 [Hansschlegelia zhihuaiae]
MSAFEPKTLRDAVVVIGLLTRANADRGFIGREESARLLSMREPDLLLVVVEINGLRLSGDHEGAWQLLQALSLIVVAGGWPAVVADPEASAQWPKFWRPGE